MAGTARAWALLTVIMALTAVAVPAIAATDDGLSEERIHQVAAALSERPAGFGRPIGDRAAWEELARHQSYRGLIAAAEQIVGQPIPEQPDELYLEFSRTGSRTRWGRVSWRRRGRIKTLALAECLENRGRFLPAFEETVRALCSERTWVMPAHDRQLTNFHGQSTDIDLASSALAWNLATAGYLLGEKLSPDIRRLIRANVRRRVLDPYLDMTSGEREANWWLKTTSNWNAVCLAGVTGAALAQVESRGERALFIVAAEEHSKNFLKGFPPDGYCTEGVGYWNYGFGHYLLLAEAVHQATGGAVDLLQREAVLQPATYGARIEIAGGVCPAFADCTVGTRPGRRVMYFVSRRYGLGMREYEAEGAVSSGGSLAEAMMYSFPNSASRTPPAPEAAPGPGLRTWFDHAGILIGRPGRGSACRLGVALKGGHNAEHHNHNDVGSYVVVVGRQALLLDPGAEVYTARTFSARRYDSNLLNSYGHPVPLVAGRLQKQGRDAAARVVRTEFTDDADTLVLDISSAYDVPGLAELQRTFVYSRKGAGSLTVTDEVRFDSPSRFGTALITFGRWKRHGPDSLMVYDTEEAVRVDIRVRGGEFDIHPDHIKEDMRSGMIPVRLGIDLKEPVTEASITTTITPVSPVEGGDGQLLRNGGFEDAHWGWTIPRQGMGTLSTEQAAGGGTSLKIVDADRQRGSNITSARIPTVGPGSFELRGKVLPVSGEGLAIYVRFLDEDGGVLNEQVDPRGWIDSLISLGGSTRRWEPFAARFTAPEGTVFLQVWIHSYTAAEVEAYLDDLEIVPLDEGPQ